MYATPPMNARLALALTCVAIAVGCSSSPWRRTAPPLYNTPGLVLFREHLEKEGQQVPLGHKHPIKVPADKLAYVMSQLKYRQDRLLKSIQVDVFVPAEIAATAEPIALALAEIQPDERLRFLILRSTWSEVLFGPSGTTGVMFSDEEGVLQIAFDRVLEGLSLPEGNEPMRIRFPDDPTEISDGSPLYPPPGTKLHAKAGTIYPRWLEVQLTDIAPPPKPAAVTPPPVGTQPAIPPAEPPKVSQPAVVIQPAVAPPQPGASGDAEKEARYQRVRDRIEALNRLRKDGVVSEQQYQAEFQKAMAELEK